MEDRIAISRLKQGDLNSLETLVNRYQARAIHAAYLILFDCVLAEDVAQSAFIKVVERIHQFDEQRPFAPWFFRIVVNDALKAAHKHRSSKSLYYQGLYDNITGLIFRGIHRLTRLEAGMK